MPLYAVGGREGERAGAEATEGRRHRARDIDGTPPAGLVSATPALPAYRVCGGRGTKGAALAQLVEHRIRKARVCSFKTIGL